MHHLSTTCPDIDTARDIAQAALAARLAACANITPGLVSVFHWNDGLEEEEEVRLTFKTREAHLANLVALIEEIHPYDLPVITWEKVNATPAAEGWLAEETAP